MFHLTLFHIENWWTQRQTIQTDTECILCNLSHHLDQLEAIKMCTAKVLMQYSYTHMRSHHVRCSPRFWKSTCWQFITAITMNGENYKRKQNFENNKKKRRNVTVCNRYRIFIYWICDRMSALMNHLNSLSTSAHHIFYDTLTLIIWETQCKTNKA